MGAPCRLGVLRVGSCHCSWADVPILCHGGWAILTAGGLTVGSCHCLWVQGMGAPHFLCSHAHGGRLSFVGGWSGCSSSLVGFRGLWAAVVPVSCCGGQSSFAGVFCGF